jgi:hypothetical protein
LCSITPDVLVAALVHTPPVCGAAHLRLHLVEGEVERAHLVLGGCFGADHRPLGEGGELHLGRAIVLARVLLELHLNLDPHDAVVVLLQTGELLRDVFAKPVGHLAVPSCDHNLHVNLLLASEPHPSMVPGGVRRGRVGWSPPGRPGLRPHNRLLKRSQLLRHDGPSPGDRHIWCRHRGRTYV